MNPISIRSSWSRSTFSTSAHSIASSMRRNRQTPSSSMPRGRSVSGPQTPTSAPSFRRPQMFERALRGMLVLAVAGVDDVRANPVAQELGGAGGGMADDHHIDPHRFEVSGGVDQGLALLHRAAACRHVDGVGGEALFRELERDAGARGGFEEQVDYGLAAERRDFLDRPLGDFLEGLGGIEDEPDLVRREVLEPHQVLADGWGGHGGAPWRTTSTSSRPSI